MTPVGRPEVGRTPCPCGGKRRVYYSVPADWHGIPVRRRHLRCVACGQTSGTWELEDDAVAALSHAGLLVLAPGARAQTQERHVAIVAAWGAGLTYPEIARAFGVTRQAVGQVVRQWRQAAG